MKQYHWVGRGSVNLRVHVFDDFRKDFKGFGPVFNLYSTGGVNVEYTLETYHPDLPDMFFRHVGLFLGNFALILLPLNLAVFFWRLEKSKEGGMSDSMV